MGDAIHLNVPALAQAGTDMVAGYVTGTPDIQWTASDFALFAGKVVVTIDQGANGSPVGSANVRDVEAGAWTPAAAVQLAGWTAPRPTIYCNLSTLPAVTGAGWTGDVWLADLTSAPPTSPPPVGGVNVVAQQYALSVAGAYDLSVVFDPAWPSATTRKATKMIILSVPSLGGAQFLYTPGQIPQHIVSIADLQAFQAAGLATAVISAAQYQLLSGQA
jgi:hypothetical protein